MLGWKIVEHSVRQVWDNRDQALILTLFPYGVLTVLRVLFPTPEVTTDLSGQSFDGLPSGGEVFTALIVSIITLLMSLWIAVLWHRLVLEGERATGWIPKWQGGRMANYFWRGLLIGLLMVLIVTLASVVLGLVLSIVSPLLVLLPFIVIGVAAWVFYRLCPVLPAAAIDRPMTFKEAWTATQGQAPTILVLVLVVVIGTLIMSLPAVLFGDPSGTLAVVYSAVVGWFLTLISASILTTFYSHFIEGRPIG